MTLYLVQDSDLPWDSEEGQAVIVRAGSPLQAAEKARPKMEEADGDKIDGASFRVSEVTLPNTTFIMGGREDGGDWRWDTIVPMTKEELER